MGGPLEGVTVLDLTRVLAGPFCTMLLSDMGAEVIKVEIPGRGDDSRHFGPFKEGESGYYIFLNRGKKSMTLNLKHPKGVNVFKKLVAKADVVVENFKPGVADKLGIGYSVLSGIDPSIIFASISGFGQYGPLSAKPAYDLVAQAMGGIMSITGFPDNPPTRVGSSLGDISAGLFAAFGIVSALYKRKETGKGQHIDVAMVDSVFSFLESNVMRYTMGNEVPTRVGSRHPLSSPFDIYRAGDGYVVIAIANDQLFERFCNTVGFAGLDKDPRFATDQMRNRYQEELKELIECWSKNYTVDEIVSLLDEASVPSSPVLDIEQICNAPHIKARNMLLEVNHPVSGKVKIPGNPVKLSDTPIIIEKTAPLLGEHNSEILTSLLGLTGEEVNGLQLDGVI